MATNGISSRRDLETEGTPQFLATEWIAHGDKLRLAIPDTNAVAESFKQRYVLAVFYYALGGPNWTIPVEFLSAKSECSWFDFKESNGGFDLDSMLWVTCNADNTVSSISIRKLFCEFCAYL